MIILKYVFYGFGEIFFKFDNIYRNIDNMKIIIEILYYIMIKIVVIRLEDVFLLILKGKLLILILYDIDYNVC